MCLSAQINISVIIDLHINVTLILHRFNLTYFIEECTRFYRTNQYFCETQFCV